MSSEPLAYLITFRTYGTWLPGDDRGSVDREHRNWSEPLAAADVARRNMAYSRLAAPPVTLTKEQRHLVSGEIQRQCDHRSWLVHAINVRTEHLHLVVRAPQPRERVMNTLKSYLTRRLREAGLWQSPVSPWSRHGSTRYLWTDGDVEAACAYVNERQDSPRESAPRPGGSGV